MLLLEFQAIHTVDLFIFYYTIQADAQRNINKDTNI